MKRGEVLKYVLLTLAVAGIVITVTILPNIGGVLRLFPLSKRKEWKDRARLRRVVRNLEKQKLVRLYQREGKEILEITEKGKKRILTYKFDDLSIPKPNKWDGFFRIVIFDIPEKNKRARKVFRHKLKELGFYPLQDSVLVYPYECKDQIDFLRRYLFIEKYVRYFVTKEFEDKLLLKRHFKIV